MRVLLLRRSNTGELARLADDMATWLPRSGYSVIVEDATWIPRETSATGDREVSRQLRNMGDGFDLLHAFGYRAAWACAEAFRDGIVWLYTANELPPESPSLLSRLNEASLGICTSALVRNALAGMGAQSLDVIAPGVGASHETRLGREETRRQLGIPQDAFVVGSFSDYGLVDAAASVSDATFVLAEGNGARDGDPANLVRAGWVPRTRDFMEACDLWVSSDPRRGFCLDVAEAMFEGTPVLVRSNLRDMVEEDVSGFLFADVDALPARISEIRSLELARQTVGEAGRVRAREHFDLETRIGEIAQRYRDVVEEVI